MEIRYDKSVDALYIKLKDAAFAKNKKINDSTILDLAEDGSIIGIEILDASKTIPHKSLSQIKVKKQNSKKELAIEI